MKSGTPADSAGVKAGDIVTKIDGTNVDDANDLTAKISAHQPGDKVTLTVTRNGATKSEVGLFGEDPDQVYQAKIIGRDELTDSALIQLTEKPNHPLPEAKFGDSSQMSAGDWVVAIGNPIGLDQTMTRGIVSALNRLMPGISDEPMIQTDAPINPGNSGGPLVDRCSNVIGINTLISEDAQSIGFAVPINATKGVLRELRESGRVVRPLLLRLAGAKAERLTALPVKLAFAYSKKTCRREYVRVALRYGKDGVIEAVKHPQEGAGVITSLTETDGLAELGEDTTSIKQGATAGFLSYATLMG